METRYREDGGHEKLKNLRRAQRNPVKNSSYKDSTTQRNVISVHEKRQRFLC